MGERYFKAWHLRNKRCDLYRNKTCYVTTFVSRFIDLERVKKLFQFLFLFVLLYVEIIKIEFVRFSSSELSRFTVIASLIAINLFCCF